jgi:hypothetical protein
LREIGREMSRMSIALLRDSGYRAAENYGVTNGPRLAFARMSKRVSRFDE